MNAEPATLSHRAPLFPRLLLCALLAATADAAEPTGPPTFTARAPVITRHSGSFNGRKVAFTATVEGLDVADSAGRHGARVVSFAYTADQVAGQRVAAAQRPVMFFFNGGPIVASP